MAFKAPACYSATIILLGIALSCYVDASFKTFFPFGLDGDPDYPYYNRGSSVFFIILKAPVDLTVTYF
jgi:hypothetical protein